MLSRSDYFLAGVGRKGLVFVSNICTRLVSRNYSSEQLDCSVPVYDLKLILLSLLRPPNASTRER